MSLDASQLAAALDAWERYPDPLEHSPYEAFRARHRKEARYLWLISRRFRPPEDVDPRALRNLLAWGLVRPDGTITRLGERLLAASRSKLSPDLFAGDPSASRVRW